MKAVLSDQSRQSSVDLWRLAARHEQTNSILQWMFQVHGGFTVPVLCWISRPLLRTGCSSDHQRHLGAWIDGGGQGGKGVEITKGTTLIELRDRDPKTIYSVRGAETRSSNQSRELCT